MVIRGRSHRYYPRHEPEPDPWARLAGAVLLQAASDLLTGPLLKKADAFMFLTGDAGLWASLLGMDLPIEKVLGDRRGRAAQLAGRWQHG